MEQVEKDIKKHGFFNYTKYLTYHLQDKKNESGMEYVFHGITGPEEANIFNMPHCETDRFWRKQLAMTPERY